MLLSSISTLILLCVIFATSQAREITTDNGPVEGKEVGGGVVFLGIPYAEPPIEAMRFRPPQKKRNWEEPLLVQDYQKACIYATVLESTEMTMDEMSENCLYLNVFTNEACIETQNCKVLVYIHGGYHGTTHFKEEVLVQNFLDDGRNIIVVTVAYRLGILGNINLVPEGDSSAARNIALLDIIEALNWVEKNIFYFGGNPLETTVLGHDTGAQNVYHLSLSPTYHNLFQQAILMSGYDLQAELYTDRNTRTSRALAEQAKCATDYTDYTSIEQSEAVVGCLRNLSGPDLVQFQLAVEGDGYYFLGNVLDNFILPGSLDSLLVRQAPTKLIVGCSGNENEISDIVVNGTVDMEKLRFYCEIVAKERNYKYLTQATADCVKEYNHSNRAVAMKNDVYYFTSAWNVAYANVNAGGTSRLYEFSPRKDLTVDGDHDDLITYLFGYEEGELDETDQKIRVALTEQWCDFINGVDREEWPKWPDYYLIDYNADVEMTGASVNYHPEAIAFWNENIERDGNVRLDRPSEPWLKEIEDSVVFGGLLVSDRFDKALVIAIVTIIVCIAFLVFVLLLVFLSYMNRERKPETIVYTTRNSNNLPR